METVQEFAPVVAVENSQVNTSALEGLFDMENTPETVIAENIVEDLRPMVCLVYKDLNENIAFMLFSSSDIQHTSERLIAGVNYHIGYQVSNANDKRINYGTYIEMYEIPNDKITIPFEERSPGLWLYTTSSNQPVVNIPAQYSEDELVSLNINEANSNNYTATYAYHNIV